MALGLSTYALSVGLRGRLKSSVIVGVQLESIHVIARLEAKSGACERPRSNHDIFAAVEHDQDNLGIENRATIVSAVSIVSTGCHNISIDLRKATTSPGALVKAFEQC